MNEIMTIIKFTISSRFRMKSFKVMTLLFVILITIGANVPYLIKQFSSGSDKATEVGIVADEAKLGEKLTPILTKYPGEVKFVPVQGGEEKAKSLLKHKELEGYLVLKDGNSADFPDVIYKDQRTTPDTSMKLKLHTILQTVKSNYILSEAGLTESQLNAIQSPVHIETEQVNASDQEAGKTQGEQAIAYIFVYAINFLLYMSILGYGQMVATEITAEKSSRVMEILITSVSPLKQMFGKIFGICILGLVQILLCVITVFANLMLPWNRELLSGLNLSFRDLPIDLIIYFVIFYLAGFFIYATMYAAVGSMVSRTDELGQAVMPVMFLVIISFFIASFGMQNPNSTLVTVMSFIPFFSPLIMFLRIGLSDPALWEILISIGIMFASIGILAWLSAKIYRAGVLMYGKLPSFKELRKAMKSFNA